MAFQAASTQNVFDNTRPVSLQHFGIKHDLIRKRRIMSLHFFYKFQMRIKPDRKLVSL